MMWPFKKKLQSNNNFTFGKLIWGMFTAKRQADAMMDYLIENFPCEPMAIPSMELKIRYRLRGGMNSGYQYIWAALEEYVKSRKK